MRKLKLLSFPPAAVRVSVQSVARAFVADELRAPRSLRHLFPDDERCAQFLIALAAVIAMGIQGSPVMGIAGCATSSRISPGR
jgi:hypothetical protein